MAKLTREIQKVFGETGGSGEFGKIGSKAAGSPVTTKDITLIQDLAQYLTGLTAIVSDQGTSVLPYLEDMNSLFYLATSQLAYLFQAGIPEWLNSSDQRYYKDASIVQVDGDIYLAIKGDDALNINTQKDPTSEPTWWRLIVSSDGAVNLTGAQTIAGVKTFSSIPIVPSNPIVNGDTGAVRGDDVYDHVATREAAIKNAVWPVGSTYIQFPGDSSPATLGLPGTWSNVSSALAGDFIRFEGGRALAFNGGRQGDAMQRITGTITRSANTGMSQGDAPLTGVFSFGSANSYIAANTGGTGYDVDFDNADSTSPNTAKTDYVETRSVNRTVRKWKRTS